MSISEGIPEKKQVTLMSSYHNILDRRKQLADILESSERVLSMMKRTNLDPINAEGESEVIHDKTRNIPELFNDVSSDMRELLFQLDKNLNQINELIE